MSEAQLSLYERRMAAGVGPWADVYGGEADNFEVKKYHDGYYVDGVHHGKEVKDVIDLFHGVLCRIVRPDHPKLVEARRRATETGVGHIGKTHLHESTVRAMEVLKAEYDELGIGKGRTLLATTGSGANAMAYNIARAFTHGGEALYLENDYHGNDYLGKASVGAQGWPGEFPPELPTHEGITTRHVPHGDPQRLEEHLKVLNGTAVALGAPPIFYFEDIQGVGGSFKNPGKQYLTAALDIIGNLHGVAVNDNVQSGMRRGSYLSVPKWLLNKPDNNTPLIITLAKALGNGVPIGAVLVPEVIVDDMKAHPERYGLHWDTFAEQVPSAEEVVAVHDIYHDEKLGERTPELREAVERPIRDYADANPGLVTDIRGDGLMIGVGLAYPKTNLPLAIGRAPESGVIIGKGADALRIAPLADTPLDIAKEAGERVVRLLESLPRTAVSPT